MDYTSIEKYINTFDPIEEGHRDDTLQKKGILLRTRFGLTGDDLVSALSGVNQTKCNPPLSESDVVRIARSVDGANAPIGESTGTFECSELRIKTQPKPKDRTWHCTCSDSVPVDTLLAKTVSAYPNCWESVPSGAVSIGQFLDDCKNGTYREQVEAIRAEPDKDRRDKLKQELPAITPHANPAKGKTNAVCDEAGRSGIVVLDFDNIEIGELESAKQRIAALDYVFAVSTSASGRGFFAFAAYTGTPNLETLLEAMQADFPNSEIDMTGKNIARLRYATFDPDIIIKDEVFPAVLTEQTEPAAENIDERTSVRIPVIRWTDYCDIQDEEDLWAVPEIIPLGELCIISGRQGNGKTFVTAWLAALITNGGLFRGEQAEKGAVLFFPPEGKKHKIMRRLRKAGANLSLAAVIDSKIGKDGKIIPLNMKSHNELEIIIDDYEAIKNVRVQAVIIDPVGIYLGGANPKDYGDVSALLAPLATMCTERNISIILVHHHKKGDVEYGGDKTMGSQAWNSVPRMAWQVHVPPNGDVRYFLPDKNSDGESKGFMFRIVSDEPKATGYLVIENDGIADTADSFVMQKPKQGESKIDRCCQWLQETIPSEGKDKDDVIAEGKAQGFGSNMIYKAFKSIGGESEKLFSGMATWTIPILHTPTVKNGEFPNLHTPAVKNGSLYENRDETAIFDEKTSNPHGHTQYREEWEKTDDFGAEAGEYRNAESAPQESTLSVPLCPQCVHHCPATHPGGLCAKEYCQMDLPCCDFVEAETI